METGSLGRARMIIIILSIAADSLVVDHSIQTCFSQSLVSMSLQCVYACLHAMYADACLHSMYVCMRRSLATLGSVDHIGREEECEGLEGFW